MTNVAIIDHQHPSGRTMALAMAAAGLLSPGLIIPEPDTDEWDEGQPGEDLLYDALFFGEGSVPDTKHRGLSDIIAWDEATGLPSVMDIYLPGRAEELPWFLPRTRKQTILPEVDASTFKSKRVKANRARKRQARKARRAQS